MNIRKTGEWNVKEGTFKIIPMYITKGWHRITGYKTRGYRNRVKLIGRSKTYIDNYELTKYFKKNRVHQLVGRSYAKPKQ
jgi:hypothetical protein